MLPRHIRVGHALQDAHRAAGLDHAAEEKMIAAFLDQLPGDEIRLRRILRRPRPNSVLLELAPDLGRKSIPHQLFGEIDRRRDEHQAGDARRACFAALPQGPHHEQRDPAAHRRADQNLRTLAASVEYREAIGEPAADRAVSEGALRFAMAGIVEPQAGAALAARPIGERGRLGAGHVGLVAAKPK